MKRNTIQQDRALLDLRRAMFMVARSRREDLKGRGVSRLRSQIILGEHDHCLPDMVTGTRMMATLDAMRPEDMDPALDLFRIMVETVAQRRQADTLIKAWVQMGISAKFGESLLNPRRGTRIGWPTWYLVWDCALGSGNALTKRRRTAI